MKLEDCYVGQKVGMSVNGVPIIGKIEALNSGENNGLSDQDKLKYGVATCSFEGSNTSYINTKYLIGVVK